MNRLPRRIHLLQRILPVAAFVAVLVHQIFEHTLLRSLPWGWHFLSQMAFYGLVGPTIILLMLRWIARSVETQNRVAHQLATLYTFSRRLATVPDERLAEIVVEFPAQLLNGVVGCVFTLINERSNTVTVEATWGFSPPTVDMLRRRVTGDERYRHCTTCRTLRATFSSSFRCPAFSADVAEVEGVRSVLCLPLGRGDKRIGYLNVYLDTDVPPSADMLQLLNTMAAEAAPAIEAARLRNRELTALYHVNHTLRRKLDLDGMLRQILQDAVDACEASSGAILLREAPNGPFRVCVTVPEHFTLEAAQALGELAAERCAPVHIAELDGPRGKPSAVAVPMTVGDSVVGVLCITQASSRALSERQVRLLSAIASQTALIVQNVRFYERLESYAILEERARLARELHDGLAQGLGYLHLKVQQTLRRLRQGRPVDTAAELAEMRAVIQDLYAQARAAISGLRAPFDPNRPFADNLRAYIEHVAERFPLALHLDLSDPHLDLPPTVAAHVFRIVQEGLNNVVKHANAERATVRVRNGPGGLTVAIEDDGQGFNPDEVAADHTHFGLNIMRERAEALGGTLQVRSELNRGTVITLHVPQEHLLLTYQPEP